MIKQRENFRSAEQKSSDLVIQPVAPIIPENLFQVIWRGRWFLLFATILALAIAFVYLLRATPIFTSTSRIYVEQSGPKIITEMEEGFMTRSKNYLYTQAELLKSTPILAAVLEIPIVSQMNTFVEVDNQIVYLKKHLDATVGRKNDIISVSFDSPFPAEAAQIVNAVVDCYVTYHATHKRSTAAEVLRIVHNEKSKRNKELSEKLKNLMDFRRQHLALTFENENGHIILQRLSRLSSVLTEAQLAVIEAKCTYESTKEMVKDPTNLRQFVDAQRAQGIYRSTRDEIERDLLTSKLELLQRRRADRLRQLTSNHSSVKALEIEIAQVEKQFTDLDTTFAQAQLAVAQQQYLAAREKEAQISKQLEDQREQAEDLNEKLAQYTLLRSEWEQTKKLCDILDDRMKELNVTEDVGALNINILEVARPATTPSKPQKARILGMALVLGLMLGGGLSIISSWMDQQFRSVEEISAIIGVPILGVVPSMSRRLNHSLRGQRIRLEPTSPEAEAFRTVRTALFFGASKDEAKTVLVTSPAPGDGKSTLVSNLGIAMAQAGQKTLIIDADFRKPMQHNIFEVNHHDRGLSSVLAGKTKLLEAIQPTGVKGLELLTSSPEVRNAAELLNSKSFARLLQHLAKTYDRVLVDSPPLGLVTDAEILGALCNITVLVLRVDKSMRRVSQRAKDGLQGVGARIVGTVVNDVPRKHGRYGCYGGHQYSQVYYGTKERRKNNRKTKLTEPVVASCDRHKELLSRNNTIR